VQEVPAAAAEDARRRIYTLTKAGRILLDAELARIESMLRKARGLRTGLGQGKP
jgi:DNA-binding PadR family transcriptional regulator